MGDRANLVVIQDGSVRAYYDQWAALGCLHFFADGADEAIGVPAELEPATEPMDWAFAEGGCLIDLDHRAAIVFGEVLDEPEFDLHGFEELPAGDEVPEFEPMEYLQPIRSAWRGWRLIFDGRRVDAFAAYLQAKQIHGIQCQPLSHPPDARPQCEVYT
ncbi:MAG TPA: hypothetical protein EYH34_16320 [Planctomycetes bacterium]|nr:hypothetical protein [Planctomycetota bacterium]